MGPRSYQRGAWSSLVLLASLACAVVAGPASSGAAAAPTTVVPAAPATPAPATPALVELPAPADTGQVANLSTEITHHAPEGTFIWTIYVTSTVTAVQGDSYTTRSTISSIDETRPEAGTAPSPFDSLYSLSFDQVFAANGAFREGTLIDGNNLSREQRAAGDAVLDYMAMASIGFPSEPIAVGESWTSRNTVGSDGIQTAVDVQCRLTSVAADTYTVDVSYSTSAAGQTAEGWVDATVSGSGSFTGSLTNPLVVNGSLNQTVDGILTAADGSSSPWNKDTTIVVTATG